MLCYLKREFCDFSVNVKIELDSQADAGNRIEAYSPGQVVIAEQHYNTSLIVSPGQLISDWPPQQWSDLAAHHLDAVIELQPEIIIIGTGQHLHFPANDVLQPLLNGEFGYEIMDTGAACRCYNVLATEGRNVVAALMMIETGG